MSTQAGPVTRATWLGRVIIFLILAITAAAFVLAHVLAWRWVRQPFPGFLVEPTLVLSPFGGKDWARFAFDPPLEQPDRLTAIDGQAVRRAADISAILSKRAPGEIVQVAVTRPDGSQRTETILLASFPLRELVLIFLLPYLAGLVYLGIGIWVYWVQGWGVAGQAFTVLCAAIALALGTLFDLNTTHRLAALWSAAIPLAAAAVTHLALVFPQSPRFVERVPALRLLPYLPAIYLAFRSILSVYDTSRPWAYLTWWYAGYIFAAAGIFLMLGMQLYRMVKPPSPLVRQQSRIILLGATLAFLPIAPWFLLVALDRPVPFPTLLYAPLITLFPLSIAYAILRYRLLDVDRLLSRGVTYTALTSLVVAAYTIIINGLSHFAAVEINDPVLLSLFVLTLVLVFDPLRRWVQRLVDRVFHREEVDYRAALQDISQELTHTLDLRAVLDMVGARIDKALHPTCQWVCLYDEDIGCYTAQPMGRGEPTPFPITFMPDGALAHTLLKKRASLYLPAEQGLPEELADEWMSMGALGAVVYAPLYFRERLIGWLAVGPKRSGQPYHLEDISFLSTLANQSALAVENARLFTSVRRNLAAITEMKNLMDDVFSSIASGVITTDIKDKITLFNRAAETILGIKAEQVIGAPCHQVLCSLGGEMESLLKKVKLSGETVMAYETQPELPARGPVWLRMNLSPLKDSRNVTTGVAIVMDDLTEQRMLEAQARRIRETFEHYVAPAVVDRLLSNPNSVRLEGARQEITSFYADIRGFTAFSEKTDPEFQIEVLNKHLTLATEAILEQEGTLDKFVGDAVMAIFNAPEPQDDHTLRAVRAAVMMQQAIHKSHEQMDERERLYFGIGITVGEAVVGNIGSATRQENFTAIGDCVNFSARLSDLAGPGQVLISAKAYERVKDYVEARFVGDVHVKGHSHPDQVYEVLGLKESAG